MPPRFNPIHKVSTVTACVVQVEGLGGLLSSGWGHVCSGIRPSTHRGGLGKGSSTQGPSCIPGVPSMGNGADLADSIFWCICFFPQPKSSTSFQVGEWESKTS